MMRGGVTVEGAKLAKVKLERYARIKKEMKKEWWLRESRVWTRRWVKVRAGVERLAVETGRWKRVPRVQRVCKMCNSGEAEDEGHALDRCIR